MDITALIIQLVAGAVGGNAAGAALKNLSLGSIGNTIAGVLGGGLGGFLMPMLGMAGTGAEGMDIGAIVQNVLGGGVGGGVVMAIIGAVKKALVKS
jgi:uncharacterized membrane protein YeaQ/YmgE (transglycosylase-associated protein family)